MLMLLHHVARSMWTLTTLIRFTKSGSEDLEPAEPVLLTRFQEVLFVSQNVSR